MDTALACCPHFMKGQKVAKNWESQKIKIWGTPRPLSFCQVGLSHIVLGSFLYIGMRHTSEWVLGIPHYVTRIAQASLSPSNLNSEWKQKELVDQSILCFVSLCCFKGGYLMSFKLNASNGTEPKKLLSDEFLHNVQRPHTAFVFSPFNK